MFFSLQTEDFISLFTEIATKRGSCYCCLWRHKSTDWQRGLRSLRKNSRLFLNSKIGNFLVFSSKLTEKLTTHFNFHLIAQTCFNLLNCFTSFWTSDTRMQLPFRLKLLTNFFP